MAAIHSTSIYVLYIFIPDDADNNYALDIMVWGEYANTTKCMYLLLQNNNEFSQATADTLNFDATNTQPILF
jgi:hypothetical protein